MEAYIGEKDPSPPQVLEIRPRNAVIIYGDASGTVAYASVHPVRLGANGKGRPSLGPGEPITTGFTRKFLAALGEELKAEFLPANVLYRTHEGLVWWTPARREEMRFRAGSELAKVSGKRLPLPPLVWRLGPHSLAVRALAHDARPEPKTALCIAPLWNTSPMDGVVCEGSMRKPRERGPAAIEEWDDAFFGSEFTHQAGAGSLARTMSYADLLRNLARSKDPYPLDELVPTQQTLHAFASGGRNTWST
jgi:PRTRC genetic system protein B